MKLLNCAKIRNQKAVSVWRVVEYFVLVESGVSGVEFQECAKLGFVLCRYLRVSRLLLPQFIIWSELCYSHFAFLGQHFQH